MQKNKLNLHVYGIHLLNPHKTVVSHLSCLLLLWSLAVITLVLGSPHSFGTSLQAFTRLAWGPFLESPETFRAHLGWYKTLCIFKTKVPRATKLCSYFTFCPLYNIWNDQLSRISGSKFYEWLFGPESFWDFREMVPASQTHFRLCVETQISSF